jgi:hypothetical protein
MLRVSAVWGAKVSILWSLVGSFVVALVTVVGLTLVYIVHDAGE